MNDYCDFNPLPLIAVGSDICPRRCLVNNFENETQRYVGTREIRSLIVHLFDIHFSVLVFVNFFLSEQKYFYTYRCHFICLYALVVLLALHSTAFESFISRFCI